MWKNILNMFGSKEEAQTLLNRTILVIDDGEIERKVATNVLESRGCKVITAIDGQSGLDFARTTRPDLICLDIGLPDIHGIEVCKKLKRDKKTQHIPIIFMTGQDSPNNVIDSYDVGADVYLAKPVDGKTLIRNIEQVFQDLSTANPS